MLLTNQKTINYENLSKKLRKPLLIFDGAKIITFVVELQQKNQL
jgi:hypothetical protein